jgi:hypothetical protein
MLMQRYGKGIFGGKKCHARNMANFLFTYSTFWLFSRRHSGKLAITRSWMTPGQEFIQIRDGKIK